MQQPGDARSGTLPQNLAAFGRCLRRAGVPVDSARIALATQATLAVGLARKDDLGAALEAVLVSREQDREVFRELFEAFFRDPDIANKLLAQMLPRTQGKAEPSAGRGRVSEALSPRRPEAALADPGQEDPRVDFDAAMTASERDRLNLADFNTLSASEYRLVERLARELPLPLPEYAARRSQQGSRGHALHWNAAMRRSLATGGEWFDLPRRERRRQPVPLLVLIDVSGSMERYSRLLLSFLHAATRRQQRRDVFAIGTRLTDLTPAFRQSDADLMLARSSALIQDYAGGTRLGDCLQTLRRAHAHRLVGRRTLVLLITDGLDTGEPQQLEQQLAWLQLHCASLLWLNPLLRFDGYAPLARGASVLHRMADGMLAVHNLSRLQDLAASLAQVVATAGRGRAAGPVRLPIV